MSTTVALPKRHELPKEYTWDLESVYPSPEAWEEDFARVEAALPEFAAFEGTLGRSADRLLAALALRDEVGVTLHRVVVYAALRKDEDTTNPAALARHDRATMLATRADRARAFIEPEILALPDGLLERFMSEEPGLERYRHYLDDLARQRAHVRSAEVEALLAEAGEVGRAPESAFAMLNNADLKFPSIRDEDGREVELTKGRYLRFIESPDRRVRKDAFTALYASYRAHRHTIAATLAGAIKRDVFFARARRHGSALEAALSEPNIPLAVYHRLIETVQRNLPRLHRYFSLRRRILGLDELRMYDLATPLVPAVDVKIPFPEAAETVAAALAPLGDEYVGVLREGLGNRWIDVYENEGKTSGAYSWGAYGTRPFILLNYQDNLDGMYALAHELGHSLHSHFTWTHQPPVYGHYTMFVAEVASTLNEALLTHHLLQRTDDPRLRMRLVNQQLDAFRTTLFRQTMFAEFELQIHERVERGEALTAESLSELYAALNARYHGPDVVADREIELEWARIPHFYRAFYVFQYATGMCAAIALARQILAEGEPAAARYRRFLKSGSSAYSIDLLRAAGVDMESPEPVLQALDLFEERLDELERLAAEA